MKTTPFFTDDRAVDFDAGAVIFSAGDAGDRMYAVVTGEVELRSGDRVIERLGEQGVFGELALVDNAPRNLTAVTSQPSRLAVIDKDRFLWLVHETPTFALQVMSTMADRLRALTHEFDGLTDATSTAD